jgi:hypothetical protein
LALFGALRGRDRAPPATATALPRIINNP